MSYASSRRADAVSGSRNAADDLELGSGVGPALALRGVATSGPVGRLEPVEDGRSRRALLIPEGIAVCLTLAGENGEPADDPVADQAAQPVAASHLSRPGQQAVSGGAVAAPLAVHGEGNQVQRAAAQPELIPVHHPGDPCPVGQDIRQIQVVVGIVGCWQPQPPDRLKPAPQPRAQPAAAAQARGASAHTWSQPSNSTFAT